jgi:hypothetical protein
VFQNLGAYVDSIAFLILGLTIVAVAPKLAGASDGRRKVALMRAGGAALALAGAGFLIMQVLGSE